MSETEMPKASPTPMRVGKPNILDWDGTRVVFVGTRFFKLEGNNILTCGWRLDNGNPDNDWKPVDEDSPAITKARSMLGVA